MDNQPLTIHSWPRAIMHVDGDAFFSSCEQAVHPELKGKPVITGKERGIVACASYEAKAKGVERGMRLFEVKKLCPYAIIVPSDYETYSLFSVRMFEIVRRFSPIVEEYSIDEAFADLTGLRRIYSCSYADIALTIKEAIEKELGITVSVGVSITKVLAKVASRHQKPKGFTSIPGHEIHLYLAQLPVEKIWGIGPNTAALLRKFGMTTALDFARRDENFVKKYLSKPYREVWNELNGRNIYPVATESKSSYQSICKSKTFTPPSKDEAFVYGHLSKNLENACIKARRYKLAATRLIAFLRKQDFTDSGIEMKLSRPTAYPIDLFDFLRKGFRYLYEAGALYRSTGVVLTGLVSEQGIQYSLFDDMVKIEKISRVYDAVDSISEKFGKHSLHHGSSQPAHVQAQHAGDRGDTPDRKENLLKGENKRQKVGIPVMNVKV